MSFSYGLQKTAVIDMAAEAKVTATAPMQDGVPGSELRNTAQTGQVRKKNIRSGGVANEDKEFNAALRHDAKSSRFGGGRKN